MCGKFLMSSPIKLKPPLTNEIVESLTIGDIVSITGIIFTARDAAHERMAAAIANGDPLPFAVQGQIIYFVGPTPARPGKPIGSAGPTTAGRMDPYSPLLIERGLKGMVGKGKRSAEVVTAMARHKCIYLGAVEGTAALLAQAVVSAEVIAYDDLGPEAIQRLDVVGFPAVVVNDVQGRDLYAEGRATYRR